MKKVLIKLFLLSIIGNSFLNANPTKALVPYYYLPSEKNLKNESLSIAQYAYQLLYFGQTKESLNLAKLAVKLYKSDEKLWLILSEAQITNKLYEEALTSLKKAENINPKISEIHFAKANIYIKQKKLKEAKIALKTGLDIQPKNHNAIFQLGNVFLMEKDYFSAIKFFDQAIQIKPNFWQAINNKGLAYFEQDKIKLSINFFNKAISIEDNAEPLLGLASCIKKDDINLAISLVKKALKKDPNYANYDYREEQLWGEKIQKSTEKLFKNIELKKVVENAKTKKTKTP